MAKFLMNSEYQTPPSRPSPIADQPTAPWGRATEHFQQQYIRKTVKAKQPDVSSSSRWLQNQKGYKVMHTKTKTNTEPPQTMGSALNKKSRTTEPPP